MTDLLTRIRAYVAEIPTHRCRICEEEFSAAKHKWCPGCDRAEASDFNPRQDTPADALLREVAALEPVGFATHHDEPMLFPTEEEARMYCDDDEVPRGLYALTGDSHDPE
jgi:hypothetical protein